MSRGNGGMDIVVVGAIGLIEDKLNISTQQLLKG